MAAKKPAAKKAKPAKARKVSGKEVATRSKPASTQSSAMSAMSARPRPQEQWLQDFACQFRGAVDCAEWIRRTFIEADGALFNPDHEHLQSATLGVIWTMVSYTRHMKVIAGQAEMPQFQGNAWTRGRQIQQIEEWFGEVPDFVITLDAHFALQCSDAEFCRLVEHELYHCGQALNEFGAPKFKLDGMPAFAIKGHDVEEFVGVVRRYGPTEVQQQLIEAAHKPVIAANAIKAACGTCKAAV